MAKLGQIKEIKVSIESGVHAGHGWAPNMTQVHNVAFTGYSCMNRHISVNWTISETHVLELGEGQCKILKSYEQHSCMPRFQL